jgi:hypothetical protein
MHWHVQIFDCTSHPRPVSWRRRTWTKPRTCSCSNIVHQKDFYSSGDAIDAPISQTDSETPLLNLCEQDGSFARTSPDKPKEEPMETNDAQVSLGSDGMILPAPSSVSSSEKVSHDSPVKTRKVNLLSIYRRFRSCVYVCVCHNIRCLHRRRHVTHSVNRPMINSKRCWQNWQNHAFEQHYHRHLKTPRRISRS